MESCGLKIYPCVQTHIGLYTIESVLLYGTFLKSMCTYISSSGSKGVEFYSEAMRRNYKILGWERCN